MENNITQEVLKRVDTVGSKIETVIKVLAEKIGVGAEHFWPIFIKQQFVDGLTSIIVWTVPFIFSIIAIFIFTKIHNNAKKEYKENTTYYDDDWVPAIIIMVVVTAFLMIFMVISWSDSIPKMINPEYYAFKEILEMVK